MFAPEGCMFEHYGLGGSLTLLRRYVLSEIILVINVQSPLMVPRYAGTVR